jgi:hypothetical protein
MAMVTATLRVAAIATVMGMAMVTAMAKAMATEMAIETAMAMVLDSLATRPVSTRVLTGRVAGLSSKSMESIFLNDIGWE